MHKAPQALCLSTRNADDCCRYVDDAGDLDAPAGMSYAEWEAQRSEVQIPKWMEKILRIPGGAFCLLLILLPLTLVRCQNSKAGGGFSLCDCLDDCHGHLEVFDE